MRKLAIAMARGSPAIVSPALARDDAFYIGVEGGAMIVEDIEFDIGGVENQAQADTDYGYDVDGIIGYDFGAFRLEAEVAYKEADLDSYRSSVGVPFGTGTGVQPAGTFNNAAGTVSALSFMVNAMLDFGDDDGINGFVGGGAGVARVKFSDFSINRTGGFLDDSDTGFAYQAIAGVRAPLTDNVDVGLKYRFFNADSLDVINSRGGTTGTYDTRFRSHSILGSLIFNFGSPEPEPVPEPAPLPLPPEPTPPPAPVAVCTPGPYIVFFEWDRSEITPEAGSILDNAVTAYADCGQAQVMLAGHADRSGAPTYNLALSQRRADAVRSYLESRSIPAGVITTRAFGETTPRVDTADGVRELQNRRVEITYGPGSGM